MKGRTSVLSDETIAAHVQESDVKNPLSSERPELSRNIFSSFVEIYVNEGTPYPSRKSHLTQGVTVHTRHVRSITPTIPIDESHSASSDSSSLNESKFKSFFAASSRRLFRSSEHSKLVKAAEKLERGHCPEQGRVPKHEILEVASLIAMGTQISEHSEIPPRDQEACQLAQDRAVYAQVALNHASPPQPFPVPLIKTDKIVAAQALMTFNEHLPSTSRRQTTIHSSIAFLDIPYRALLCWHLLDLYDHDETLPRTWLIRGWMTKPSYPPTSASPPSAHRPIVMHRHRRPPILTMHSLIGAIPLAALCASTTKPLLRTSTDSRGGLLTCSLLALLCNLPNI
ncbi:hypothetical protein DFP72DRAFT_247102 [Ephemerocybe angulata]|uniref:Uncharacterized protein n=1 Tax=Ephemerocybe angulata TaxID=980116 RepID=A0A8H6I1I8_9AGAR|nr:hypothetical protein DFP72DRAFT_247102 [Tulosesus angulatus]